MGRVEKSIIIKAPPEKIWEMLALDRFQDWDDRAMKTMKHVEYLSEITTLEEKYQVGAAARVTDHRGKQFGMEVKESLENEKMVYYSSLMNSLMTFKLEPVQEGFKITKTLDYELPYGFFGRFLDKLFAQKMVAKEYERSLEKLKNILEQ